MLKEKNGIVRAIDIANDMNFSKPSVSIAMKKLKEKNYISVDEETGSIVLLEEGMKIASNVYNRHKVLSKFFVELGVDQETAMEDACKVEHDLSDITFEKLSEFVEKFEK